MRAIAFVSTFVVLVCAPGLARAQRTASGSAVGYEMEGAEIPEAQLEQLPAQVQSALATCASDALPYVEQAVRARLAIAPAGTVSAVAIEVERVDAAASTCVQRALTTLHFPARRAATTLILDLAFAARGSDPVPERDPSTADYRASVVAAFEDHQPAIHQCFTRARRDHESPDYRIYVELDITADGHLAHVAIPMGDDFPRLRECLSREIQTWTVPRPPTAPFPFSHRFTGEVVAYE